MKGIWGLFTVCCVICCLRPAAADIAGMACQITGKPTYQKSRTSDWKPLHLLQKVEPGDKVKCAAGDGVTIVLFGTGERFQVNANQTGTVQMTKVEGASSLGKLAGPSAAAVQTLAGARSGSFLSRAPVQESRLIGTNPGWFLEGERTVKWNAVSGASSYSFDLFDSRDNVIWHQHGAKPEAEFAAEMTAPDSGTPYIWRLVAFNKNDKPIETSMRWGVLTWLKQEDADKMKAEVEMIKQQTARAPKDPLNWSLLSEVYRKYGMLMGTLETLEDAAVQGIDVQDARKDVYRELGTFALVFSGTLK